MDTWQPSAHDDVEQILGMDLVDLHPKHRARFELMRVPLRQVPIADGSGENVVVVAEYQGKILYWSDVEEGWELEEPDAHGGIAKRGCNQFELGHVMYLIFGHPDVLE